MSASKSNCPETLDFQGYLDQQMTLPERHRLERHVRDCPCCSGKLHTFSEVFLALEKACPPDPSDEPRPGLVSDFMTRLEPAPTAPEILAPPRQDLFDLVHELRRLQRTLLAGVGFGVLVLIVVILVSYTGRSPTSRSPSSVSRKPAANLFSCTFVKMGLGDIAQVVGRDVRKLEARTLDGGINYRLSGSLRVLVPHSTGNQLQFFDQAEFRLEASGIQLANGGVNCDLGHAPGFTVSTPQGSVVTQGTRFEVKIEANQTWVRLEKGTLVLQTPQERVVKSAPVSVVLSSAGRIEEVPFKMGTGTGMPTEPSLHQETPSSAGTNPATSSAASSIGSGY